MNAPRATSGSSLREAAFASARTVSKHSARTADIKIEMNLDMRDLLSGCLRNTMNHKTSKRTEASKHTTQAETVISGQMVRIN
jgi:hypothetical protein